MSKLGLVLSGGGAYQAGVTAGSINGTILASHTESFLPATQYLTKTWGQITMDDVFYVDLMTLSLGGFDRLADFSMITRNKKDSAVYSRLSTTPLRSLINQTCQYENIQNKINAGKIRGLSVSALNYENISTKTFFQGFKDLTVWNRTDQ